jgi:hypothetical protein
MDELFFSKSKETFSTCPIEAWGRMRKHLEQLNAYKSKKMHDSHEYNALSRYIRQVEKDFAEIHPHKNFLKKYLTIEAPKPSMEIVAEKIVETPLTTIEESTSNCNGDTTCSCCKSSFDGTQKSSSLKFSENDKLIILGMFGIVSILALVLITKNK